MDHLPRASCVLTRLDLSYAPKGSLWHPAAPEGGEGEAKCWRNSGMWVIQGGSPSPLSILPRISGAGEEITVRHQAGRTDAS